MEEENGIDEGPAPRELMVRLGTGLFTLVAIFAVLSLTFREPVEQIAAYFVDQTGLFGVFGLVLLVDTLPLTHEPILFLGYSGGLGFVPVWLAASAGSVLAGLLGWAGGRLMGRFAWIHRVFERYKVAGFLRRYGVSAIAIAALTPFPYALATWASGTAGVHPRHVLLGSLMRIPKVLIYLSLIAAGWSVGG